MHNTAAAAAASVSVRHGTLSTGCSQWMTMHCQCQSAGRHTHTHTQTLFDIADSAAAAAAVGRTDAIFAFTLELLCQPASQISAGHCLALILSIFIV